MEHCYVNLKSDAFTDLFENNNYINFTNRLLQPWDMTDSHSLEVSLHELVIYKSERSAKGPTITTLKLDDFATHPLIVTLNLVDHQQFGETQKQILCIYDGITERPYVMLSKTSLIRDLTVSLETVDGMSMENAYGLPHNVNSAANMAKTEMVSDRPSRFINSFVRLHFRKVKIVNSIFHL